MSICVSLYKTLHQAAPCIATGKRTLLIHGYCFYDIPKRFPKASLSPIHTHTHTNGPLVLSLNGSRQYLTCDMCKMLWNRSHSQASQAQLVIHTHLISIRPPLVQSFSQLTQRGNQVPVGRLQRIITQNWQEILREFDCRRYFGCARTEWTVLREKGETKVKNETFHVSAGHLTVFTESSCINRAMLLRWPWVMARKRERLIEAPKVIHLAL